MPRSSNKTLQQRDIMRSKLEHVVYLGTFVIDPSFMLPVAELKTLCGLRTISIDRRLAILSENINQIEDKLISYLRVKLNNPMIGYKESLTPLQGGCETHVYYFKLNGVQEELSNTLVLRLYPNFYDPKDVVLEKTIQDLLASEGLPVPRTYFICTDITILGGAFFIMEFLQGKLMLTAPLETIPHMLGETHANLHKLNPEPLIKSLNEQGIKNFRLTNNLDKLYSLGNKQIWLHPVIEWLKENRPDGKDQLVICHGDFHYLNLLINEENVSGILDWSCFLVADPLFDVANTIVIITLISKHLLPLAIASFSIVNWETFAQKYLSAYQMINPILNLKHLNYYMVRRCFEAIIQGIEGQEALQNPLIVNDMIKCISDKTGLLINVPG